MTYSDCDPDRPTTPESRLRDALEADVARHLLAISASFAGARAELLSGVKTRNVLDALYFDLMKQQESLNNNRLWQSRQMAIMNSYRYGPQAIF